MTRKRSTELKKLRTLKRLGIGKCIICKKDFQRKREWHKVCSPRCRYILYQQKKVKEHENETRK
jgi:hypothetical protein